jgi:hypothetical protein
MSTPKSSRKEILRRYQERLDAEHTASRGASIDLTGLLDLLKRIWRPSKWKKLAEELVALIKEILEYLQDIRTEIIRLRKLIEELLAELREQSK